VYRIAGEIAARDGQQVDAEENYKRAIEVARQQKAKSCELRAAMSLARLWRDQGRPLEACDCLAPVYGWFTEGFETRDLRSERGKGAAR
jgi:predicted ATPase